MRIIAVILLLISGLALLGGLASLSNATSGVGGIAVACFLAILARIAQASAHHAELMSDARAAPPAAAAVTTLGTANLLLTADQIQCAKCGLIATRGPAACPQCKSPYA